MKKTDKTGVIERSNRKLALVRINQMRVCPDGQRELNVSWVNELSANFDPAKFGTPEVSWRDGCFWIVDGQHRMEAAKNFLGEWSEQSVQCWVWTDLTEEAEADLFLELNHKLNVNIYAKFKAAVKAGHLMECDILRIVQNLDLHIAKAKKPKSVGAIGTIIKVYKQCGAETLERTLSIIRDAYGERGFDSAVIDGIAKVCHRYNGALNDQATILSLSKVHGGLNGLLNQAASLRKAMATGKSDCIAAATAEIINHDRGRGKKLPSWFKMIAEAKQKKRNGAEPDVHVLRVHTEGARAGRGVM